MEGPGRQSALRLMLKGFLDGSMMGFLYTFSCSGYPLYELDPR